MGWLTPKQEEPVKLTSRKAPVFTGKRFEAAQHSRVTSNWIRWITGTFTDEIKEDLKILRTRSRKASIDDPYARAYFKVGRNHIIGQDGITARFTVTDANGALDTRANKTLDAAWKKWCISCTTDMLSMREAQKVFWETWRRDGEVLIRLLRGRNFGRYGFSLQFLEPEYLDETYNGTNTSTGNDITAGVEVNQFGTPVAYWLWERHPDTVTGMHKARNKRVRVPADEIIHAFEKERPSQYRGFPALSAALVSLHHLSDYQKAELIAAKISAAKMGFFTQEADAEDMLSEDDYEGEAYDKEDKSFTQEVTPGVFDVLPRGTRLETFDTQHPNGNFGNFSRSILQSVAASAGMAYYTLSNDLQSTNYSSLRQGAIDQRENWKNDQQFVIEKFLQPVFENWLLMALEMPNDLPFQPNKFDKMNAVEWRPKTWAWIDPAKEAIAIKLQIDYRLRSRTDVCRALGRDYEDVLQEIQSENELMQQYNVNPKEVDDALLVAAINNDNNKPEEE